MELRDKFRFKHINDPKMIYTATKESDKNEYHVTWTGSEIGIRYDCDFVKTLVIDGYWILVPDIKIDSEGLSVYGGEIKAPKDDRLIVDLESYNTKNLSVKDNKLIIDLEQK